MSNLLLAHQPCPSCTSSDAYSTYDDGHGYCFSCLKYFNTKEEFNISLEETPTYEYLPWRGVNAETFKHYDVKTKISGDGRPISLGYKYSNNSYKIRTIEGKIFSSQGDIAKGGLFGRDKFSGGSHKYVTITEGELDACSLYQVLRTPVVSVQSSGTAVRDCTLDRAWLASFERVYLAFDGDSAGREAASRVARLFDYNRVFQVKFTKRKDANEYLQAGETEELRNIWWNSKKYLPETIVSSFHDFKSILDTSPDVGFNYPFKTLTDMTYGIRKGETVLVTAQEGIGKTEFLHAIEHKILKETNDAVGAIYLEEPKKRHLQAMAGIELQRPVHLPDSGVGNDQVLAAVQELVRVDERLHIYSHFGSDDPEILLDTIRFLVAARECSYVFLDHISLAVSGLAGETERMALDFLSTRLEMMVKELNFSLILVSHVNDNGQTRGSRWIKKMADMAIRLERDILSSDLKVRNTTHLYIDKNRFSGQTGWAGDLLYDQHTRQYSELTQEVST